MHFSALFVIDSALIIDMQLYLHWWGPAPIARAHVPVCPTMAMPLGNKIYTHTIMYAVTYKEDYQLVR